jgi:hypothetical protein
VLAAGEDPVLAMSLQNAERRAPGKLVDLDPQQQMVSTIWGMQLRLASAKQGALFRGEFAPAAFTGLWQRQQDGVLRDQKLGAVYQSVIEGVEWADDLEDSPVLRALAAASRGHLSIRFNVFGYGRDPLIPRYTMGHVVGSIGPRRTGEPRHFVAGRQGIAVCPTSPFVPANRLSNFQAVVTDNRATLTVDLGNTFPIVSANSGLEDVGEVHIGVLTTNPPGPVSSALASEVVLIGAIPYTDPEWFTTTAGVMRYTLKPAARALVDTCPLVLVTPTASGFDVRVQESIDGVYVRADTFVFRLEPGQSRNVRLRATRFGKPLETTIALAATAGFMGGTGGGDTVTPPPSPPAATPDIATPPDGVTWPASVQTRRSGKAVVRITAKKGGPGTPRGYIAGQLYGLGYQLADQPASYVANPLDYVSILAFSRKVVPRRPTWYSDIQPLFCQYGNLYPIMSKYLVDLGDYASVVEHLPALRLAFSLPITDPNHMPVTRDLGSGDRATILAWLAMQGADGLPPLGTAPTTPTAPVLPPAAPAAPTAAAPPKTAPADGTLGGKTAVIQNYLNRNEGSDA